MYRLFCVITFLLLNLHSNGQGNKVELSAYSNQAEISAFETVTLKSGVHIPAGKNVNIFIATSTPDNRYLSTQPTGTKDFVLERTFKVAGVKKNTLANSRTLAEENQVVTYYDKWARPVQSASIMASASYKDVVTPLRYDAQGRSSTAYLPYADQGASDGSFKVNDLSKQSAFYSSTGWDNLVAKTTFPFSKTVYDNSPQNKVIQQGEVGASWQPDVKAFRFEEAFNNNVDFSDVTQTRKVRKFTVNSQDTSVVAVPTASGYYDDGELKVYVSKNNHWTVSDGRLNTVESYVDKRGHTIVERVFTKNDQNQLVILSTYYVYSDLGELYFVLPPVLNPDVAILNESSINKYGYRNTYDKKRRLVQKKIPGIDAIYYLYNSKNQLVASQTPNQRLKNQWSFTKYDSQGRVIINGVMTSTLSYYKLRNDANAAVNTYETVSNTGQGYTNVAWPVNGILFYNLINFYDNYEVLGLPSNLDRGLGIPDIPYPTGCVTVTKTWRNDNTSTALWTANYFDKDGQVVRTKASNHLGGIDQVDNTYNFAGELISSVRKHTHPGGQQLTVANQYTYDQVGKIKTVKQKINNEDEITLAAYHYNELGELVDKKLHQKAGQTKFLQSIDYRYNERGWLSSINDPDLAVNTLLNDGDSDSNSDLFGIQLLYNTDPNAPQYNGNIASMKWKTSKVNTQSVAPPKMGYRYRYDPLNRMTMAISEKNSSVDNAHTEYLQYDISGNITKLSRYAFTGNAKHQIDSLTYTYDGYRTKKIDDISGSAHKNLGYDDQATVVEEHIYDGNGNMIEDKNKQLTLEYDDRNLIKKITFGGISSHRLEFLYDRTGKKLQAKYTNGSNVYTIDYIDGIQYQQGQIAFIHTGEGRARRNGTTYTYEYDIKDHLGNARVTFIPDPANTTQTVAKVVQQNSYYAYGLPMYGDAANNLHLAYVSGEKSKYLYSGKELYDQGGLDWFDHGSRMYDPAIGRWSAMDPAAQFTNPYLALGNNPVIGVDPNGEFFVPILVGAAVGVLANGISNTIQDKSFFNGWGMAAIMGGVGGYMSVHSSIATMSAGQQALGAGVGVASSYLPGVNIPIGDAGYLSLSPAFAFGGRGFQMGASAGLSLPGAGDFSIGMGAGLSWGKDGFTGNRGWTSSFTGAIGYNDGTNSFSLSTTQFNSPGLRSQTLGTLSYRHKSGFGVGYSNDGAPFDKFGFADPGSDGFRSAALQFSYKELTIGTRIFTGERDVNVDNETPIPGYPKGIVGNEDAYAYMSSPFFIGYKGMRAGVDDWRIGHGVQNVVAHGILKPQVWFRWYDHGQNMKLYGGYFSSNNPFILW